MKTLIAAVASVAILSSFVTLGTLQLIEMNKQQPKQVVYPDVTDNRLKHACDAMRDTSPNQYSDIYDATIKLCGRYGYWSATEVQAWFNAQ